MTWMLRASGLALLVACSSQFHREVSSDEASWTDLHADPAASLRSYYSESFPPAGWIVRDRCFVLDSQGFGSDLMTRETYEDFELEFSWKLGVGGNSGVFFAVQTGAQYSYLTGPEIQLLDDAVHPDGKSPRTSLGALYELAEPSVSAKASLRLGERNRGRLVVRNQRLRFFVNDVLVTDVSVASDEMARSIDRSKFKRWDAFYRSPRGHVLFQDHGGQVEFCDVRIRALAPSTFGVRK